MLMRGSLALEELEALLLLLALEAFEPESMLEEKLLEGLLERLERLSPRLPFSSSREARARLLRGSWELTGWEAFSPLLLEGEAFLMRKRENSLIASHSQQAPTY
jgi:hypothetical protein